MTSSLLRTGSVLLLLALVGCTPDTDAPATGSDATAAPVATVAAPAGATASPQAGAAPDATTAALVTNFQPPSRGEQDALITIYEFSDYICPYCRSFNEDTFDKVDENYVQTGLAKYLHWDFPLAGHGYGAIVSAEASHCAADQGKYWEMHKALFEAWEAQSKLDVKDEKAAVDSAIGIGSELVDDDEAFAACVTSQKYRPVVAAMYKQAQEMGLDATPAFVIQHADPANPSGAKLIKVVLGALDYDAFAQTLDIELNRARGTVIPETVTPTPDPATMATMEVAIKTATAEAAKAATPTP